MKLKLIFSSLIIIFACIIFFTYNYISKKKEKIVILENQIINLKIQRENLGDTIGYIPFKFNSNIKFDIFDNTLNLKKYKTNVLNFTKGFGGKGSSYLDYFNHKLYLVTANGLMARTNLSELNSDNFNMDVIKTNLSEKLNNRIMYKQLAYGVKDILINDNIVYISFTDEIEKDCFNISLLEGSIKDEKINFKYFFKPKTCIKKDVESHFSLHQSGGRIVNYDDDNLLVSFGEFRSRLLAQNTDTINGKIIKINKKTKNFEIVSIGHRNPQGLLFDKDTNHIFSSEHGPKGGDEINVIKDNKQIQNFGWPIASYGEHYDRAEEDNSKLYKFAPLYKSHKNYGFIEPEVKFIPSIGISEVILLKLFNEKILIASSLGNNISEGDMSLHIYNLKETHLKNYKIVPINERIRDLIYIERQNKIILFLESSASIGVINL